MVGAEDGSGAAGIVHGWLGPLADASGPLPGGAGTAHGRPGPPSTGSRAPVVNVASAARKSAARATSSAAPRRPSGGRGTAPGHGVGAGQHDGAAVPEVRQQRSGGEERRRRRADRHRSPLLARRIPRGCRSLRAGPRPRTGRRHGRRSRVHRPRGRAPPRCGRSAGRSLRPPRVARRWPGRYGWTHRRPEPSGARTWSWSAAPPAPPVGTTLHPAASENLRETFGRPSWSAGARSGGARRPGRGFPGPVRWRPCGWGYSGHWWCGTAKGER